MDLSQAEQLAHNTVRIECDLPSGGMSTGTGFFYSLNEKEGQHTPVIITNKHVIEGASKGRFILTLQNSNGGPKIGTSHGFEIDNFQSFWHPHPDASVDLCAMPIAPLLRLAEQKGEKIFYITLNKSLIPTASEIDDMMGMEKITMVGYPNGLWNKSTTCLFFAKACWLLTTNEIGMVKKSF